MKRILFFAFLIFSTRAWAQQAPAAPNTLTSTPLRLTPTATLDINNFVIAGTSSISETGPFIVNIHNSCFDTSLRVVGGRITTTSTISVGLRLTTGATLAVSYPASAATTSPSTNSVVPLTVTGSGAKAWMFGNLVRIQIPVATFPYNPASPDPRTPQLSDYSISQTSGSLAVTGQTAYVAVSPLSAQMHIYQAPGSYSADIDAAFPGAAAYCGGFVSPLMVFFDQNRPFFRGHSKLLNGDQGTYWPKGKDPGYFLALDRNGDGRIDGDELFGSEGGPSNGFEHLRELDENRDGVIDAADPLFAKLLLFRDWQGQTELIKASEKLESIELNYNPNQIIPIADRAELRENATLMFIANGKRKKGQIVDVWLKSHP